MSKRENRASINSAYGALMMGDIEEFLSLCTKGVILNWGPFTFNGRNEVKRFAKELKQMFSELTVTKIRFRVQGNEVVHEFKLEVVTPNGLKGQLACIGRYTSKNGKINRVSIKPSEGILEITPRDFMRLMLI